MNWFTACLSALRALGTNWLRSMLTMLGIIIGVAAVITMIAIGGGAQARVEEQIKSLGTNIMLVLPGAQTTGGVRLGAQTGQTLTEEDAHAIAADVPEVQAAAPSLRTGAQVVAANANWSTSVMGSTPEYLEVRDWPLAAGRSFEAAEMAGSGKVVVIGQTVARELFGDADPIDQMIRVRKVPLQVIGVLGRKGQNSMGQDQDDVIVVPLSTYRNRVQGMSAGRIKRVGAISVKVRDGQSMSDASDKIRELLRQRHRLASGADDDFSIRNLTEMLQAQEESSRVMAAAAGRGGRRQPGGRRHRHHEHHARQRDRAHARDRPAHGGGRALARHPRPVPDRGGDDEPGRRCHRHRARHVGHLGHRQLRRLAGGAVGAVGPAGGGLLGCGGCVLRFLPGAPCRVAAADPGLAL